MKNIFITLDDTSFRKVRRRKNELGLTWEEFIMREVKEA